MKAKRHTERTRREGADSETRAQPELWHVQQRNAVEFSATMILAVGLASGLG
jgi:hypothetical protein